MKETFTYSELLDLEQSVVYYLSALKNWNKNIYDIWQDKINDMTDLKEKIVALRKTRGLL
jgi:hypothetical protein